MNPLLSVRPLTRHAPTFNRCDQNAFGSAPCPSFPPSLFSHSPFSFSFYLAHHNPNPSLQSSSSSPPTTTRTTAPAKETGQPRATSEKTQLICTTRLTHYTIAAAAVEAARDLAWGGDFFRGCRVLQAQVRSNCRGNFEQHKPPSSYFGAGPQLFPIRHPKTPQQCHPVGRHVQLAPARARFFPQGGVGGAIFLPPCPKGREEWRKGVFRGDYPGTAIGCCPFLWFCRFSFSVLNTKNVVLF